MKRETNYMSVFHRLVKRNQLKRYMQTYGEFIGCCSVRLLKLACLGLLEREGPYSPFGGGGRVKDKKSKTQNHDGPPVALPQQDFSTPRREHEPGTLSPVPNQ